MLWGISQWVVTVVPMKDVGVDSIEEEYSRLFNLNQSDLVDAEAQEMLMQLF